MLGPQKDRQLDRPVLVSLDELVPADNLYRQLEAKLDLSFVREWVGELYAERGRPSIDPIVFFKLQLDAPQNDPGSPAVAMKHRIRPLRVTITGRGRCRGSKQRPMGLLRALTWLKSAMDSLGAPDLLLGCPWPHACGGRAGRVNGA